MRCEHPHWYRRSVISEGCPTHPIAVPETIAVEHDECGRCGAWLSLGPSNDSQEAVRIEIQLAACLAEIPELWEPKDHEAAFSQAIYSSMLAAEAGR